MSHSTGSISDFDYGLVLKKPEKISKKRSKKKQELLVQLKQSQERNHQTDFGVSRRKEKNKELLFHKKNIKQKLPKDLSPTGKEFLREAKIVKNDGNVIRGISKEGNIVTAMRDKDFGWVVINSNPKGFLEPYTSTKKRYVLKYGTKEKVRTMLFLGPKRIDETTEIPCFDSKQKLGDKTSILIDSLSNQSLKRGSLIKKGGYGKVKKGGRTKTGKKIVSKTQIKGRRGEKYLEMTLTEIERNNICAKKSKNIISCEIVGLKRDKDGRVKLYYSMPRMGVDYVSKIKELSDDPETRFRQVFPVIGDLLSALAGVHDAGFVFLDLKLSNFLSPLKEDSGEGAKLCDFGCTKTLDELYWVFKKGEIIGTRFYMAPEMVLYKKIARHRKCVEKGISCERVKKKVSNVRKQFLPKIDSWAVGILIVELLTKKLIRSIMEMKGRTKEYLELLYTNPIKVTNTLMKELKVICKEIKDNRFSEVIKELDTLLRGLFKLDLNKRMKISDAYKRWKKMKLPGIQKK
ncbi:hypothetical protein ACFLZV_01040 [Candidatus Margulisiibacteriota bacterium]